MSLKTSVRWIVPALLLLIINAPCALAEPGFYESEPNNTPLEANPVAGEVTLYGTMVKGDQDGFLWTVTDDDARRYWTFELHGIPGVLTIVEIVRVEYADNGTDVTSIKRLVKMGTRDGLTPSIHRDLIFEPGEYLIGIAYAGGGTSESGGGAPFRPPAQSLSFGDNGQPEDTTVAGAGTSPAEAPGAYRLMIIEGANLNVRSDNKPRNTREKAVAARPGQPLPLFESNETSWYSFKFDDKAATQRWNIHVQVPVGRELSARLVSAAGEQLVNSSVDAYGMLTFAEMAPEATTWYLELTSPEPGFIRLVDSEITGQRVSGEEAEPNGELKLANFVDLSQPLTGRITADDRWDYFQFSVDEATADQLLTLRIESTPPVDLNFCLSDAAGLVLQCRNGETPTELPDLMLASGPWRLSVSRSKETEYSISMTRQGPVTPGTEVEPNDRIENASGVPANLRIKGRFSGEDSDFYQILVPGNPQLWRFQVIGDEIFELHYYDGAMRDQARLRAEAGQRRVQLDNMFLLPGRHFLKVSGHDGGSYILLARALGPPDPNGEIEPNDNSNKQRLAVGQTRNGILSEKSDVDYYRFFLTNRDHIRLTIQPPPDGEIEPYLYWYGAGLAKHRPGKKGEPMSIEGLFPPGDYSFSLRPREVSDAEYTIKLERLPRFSCPADCEPSDLGSFYQAASLPADLVLQGKSGEWGDWDTYQLPGFDTPTELIIHTPEPVHNLSLGTLTRNKKSQTYDPEAGIYRITVPAGEDSLVWIDSREEPYRLEVEFPGGKIEPVTQVLAADLDLELDSGKVAAFRNEGQKVNGNVRLTNNSGKTLQAELEAVTSDYRWTVALDQTSVAMAAGGSVRVPVRVQVPADAWAEWPVRISVRARDASGAQTETWKDIGVERDVSPVNPNLVWPIPDALRGGFNIAWTPLGAEWTEGQPANRLEILRDNLVFPGYQIECCVKNGGWERGQEPPFTLKLPGEQPVPVAGIALNHFGTTNSFKNIRLATLLLSQDGVEFKEALKIETLPVLTEQYFALAEPQSARFVRLRINETYEERDGDGKAVFSEWKVILQPGYDPSQGKGFNIANPELGGHLVWDWPPEPYAPNSVLVEGDASNRAGTRRESSKDYVIGFNQDRAAQITRLDWRYREGLEDRWKQFIKVTVSASLGSPVGPWRELGEMDLSGAKNGATLVLQAPEWVRFVRFTAHLDLEGAAHSEEPGSLRIWERPSGDDYRSVLSEWGETGSRGFYEQLAGIQSEDAMQVAGNNSRANAAPLDADTLAHGQVSLGKQEHWYRHRVAASDNTLGIELNGDPTVRTVVEVEDDAGSKLPLRRVDKDKLPSRHRYETIVTPGSEVWLHIAEPPRNVVFTWDTSASVNAYIPLINNSLVAFSGEVVPGQEAVNLMPFSMGPLLDQWYGEPFILQTILNDYRRTGASSSAEGTMKRAALELAPLPGTKAMVLITDAQTPHDGELWGPMQTVQPRIFGIGVAGADRADQNRFRDWASVNGGNYTQLVYEGEMEVAFDRASTLMHRPASYTLKVSSEHREAPGPGLLKVIAGTDNEALAGSAVELILDASGSMLQRMQGKRRIVVAKEVLTEAVLELIPAGTPVALRVFGHKEADACRTDLEIPLQPLDPKAAAAKIAGIQAMNLARTPIADSLKAIKADLKGASGGAAIVLVTDGEETCDGDPGQVIEALREEGVQINLNIVGFAIDNVELAAQFKSWAELGGGRYFSASNQEGLSDALTEALKVSFTVYDQGGNEVATGQAGGETVKLEQGFYRVVVHSLPQQTFDEVEVRAETEVALELK
ncbi:MAG: VWA domain-containing protein [Lysobacterales bacterium]